MNKPAFTGRLILFVFRSLKDIKYVVAHQNVNLTII